MLRDEIAPCPRCRRGLDPSGRRLYCGGCEGVLVTEAELRELIAQMEQTSMRPDPAEVHELAFEPAQSAEPAIGCPRCAARMTKHDLYGMIVDRCEAHGVWFDAAELEAALARVGEDASRMPMSHRIALTAGGVAWLAFYIASLLVRMGGPR